MSTQRKVRVRQWLWLPLAAMMYLAASYYSYSNIALVVGWRNQHQQFGRRIGTLFVSGFTAVPTRTVYTYKRDRKARLSAVQTYLVPSPLSSTKLCRIGNTVLLLNNYYSSYVRIDQSVRILSPCVLSAVKGSSEIIHSSTIITIKSRAENSNYYLVIVESPSKCKTIENILNQYVTDKKISDYKYKVTSCMGHVRDLEKQSEKNTKIKGKNKKNKNEEEPDNIDTNTAVSQFPYKIAGVELDSGQYKPIYTILPGKQSLVYDLQRATADTSCIGVLLATDPDREGEAMAWHLADVLGLLENNDNKKGGNNVIPYRRIRFTEITPDAIVSAVEQVAPAPADTAESSSAGGAATTTTTTTSSSSSSIDYNLVQAQETRRVLDRLAGFTVSPVLWKKIAPGLSAGRVQSVGMALTVQRERERLLFQTTNYSNIHAKFASNNKGSMNEAKIPAKLQSVNGTTIAATGKDFDSTRQLKPASRNKLHLKEEQEAIELMRAMKDPSFTWKVQEVKSTRRTYRPPVPYKTSTLQQEASRAFNNMPVRQVMRVAQELYEQGLISYMRTDSVSLSQTALDTAILNVTNKYSSAALGNGNHRHDQRKKNKNAQEAHEAIRPAVQSSGTFYPPSEISFTSTAAEKIYTMIYQRTLASVMKPLIINQTTVTIQGSDSVTNATFHFRTSGSVVVDPGYTIEYDNNEMQDNAENNNGDDDDDDEGSTGRSLRKSLPPMFEGQVLQLYDVSSTQHETQPPPRYTEASLVKELEALGVGRPSTYARIVQILRDRAYVGSSPSSSSNSNTRSSSTAVVRGPAISARRAAGKYDAFGGNSGGGGRGPMVPTLSAFVVTSLLEKHCPSYVDPNFTAQMEDRLDQIASGNMHEGSGDQKKEQFTSGGKPHVSYLDEFYAGENGLAAQIKRIEENVSGDEARQADLPSLNNGLLVNDVNDHVDEDIGLYIGPWGPYVQKKSHGTNDKPVTAPLPASMANDLSTITIPLLKALLSTKEGGGIILGTHPDDGRNIRLKTGRFGAYLQWGDDGDEKTATHSVPQSSVSLNTLARTIDDDESFESREDENDTSIQASLGLTLEQAVGYINLPRTVSILNELPITAAVGPYGPYLKYNNKYVSLNGSDGDVLTIDSEAAERLVIEGIVNKKAGGSSLVELGEKDGSMVTVKKGRFGAYINWKKINAKLPSDYVNNPESLPLDAAWSLIEEKAGSPSALKNKQLKTKSSKITATTRPPKRPFSAYIHFCAAKRPGVSTKGKSLGDASKELALLWAESSADDRKLYEEMAASGKSAYEKEKQEWEVSHKKTLLRPSSQARLKRSSSAASTLRKAGTAPTLKRPKSAYLFFCEAKRPEVSERLKTLGEVTKELARMWSETTDREHYAKQAANAKAQYDNMKAEMK